MCYVYSSCIVFYCWPIRVLYGMLWYCEVFLVICVVSRVCVCICYLMLFCGIALIAWKCSPAGKQCFQIHGHVFMKLVPGNAGLHLTASGEASASCLGAGLGWDYCYRESSNQRVLVTPHHPDQHRKTWWYKQTLNPSWSCVIAILFSFHAAKELCLQHLLRV